ncbi:NAD-dependent epimerase/dehydratase family protein [Cellulosimicrobium cellulans]|uniref:NAD-dependent epimerase/dehydratase family protein n=1 Tax=Cellulosimicrobium cellulans TaxID=1710 RepID=UPI0028B106CF|nr:NAD-dependent epimerase/dehydratase family protein [Cellulosimicrobium cellulans]
MRVVVVGASGNVGTAVLRRLAAEPVVTSLVAVARRVPRADGSSTVRAPHDAATWRYADVAAPDADERLDAAFAGADVVVHLAWAIQPSHDRKRLRRVNVEGTRRVVEAAQRAGVAHLVAASSVGAYSPAPYAGDARDTPVNEGWPVEGIPGSSYSEDKAAVESLLDDVDRHSGIVVSRVRSALVFQRDAASEITRYFLGPIGTRVLRRAPLPTVPLPDGLRLQVVHAEDVAEAYARIVVGRHPGPFNVAHPTVLTPQDVADVVADGSLRTVPYGTARTAVAAAWRARLVPVGEGWLDMAMRVPVLDTSLAGELLRWHPAHGAKDTLAELVDGIRDGAGTSTPPLLPR